MSMLDTPIVIRDLTVDERIALAQEIWDSVLADECGGELELSDAEMRDLDRRLDKYRANKGNLKSWEEARAEIKRRYDAHKANPGDVVLWEDVKKRLMAAKK